MIFFLSFCLITGGDYCEASVIAWPLDVAAHFFRGSFDFSQIYLCGVLAQISKLAFEIQIPVMSFYLVKYPKIL